ncbi:uncharacterized protein LOC141858284 isoform X2 [Brevipalpus obovatus]|uniref:uncharacterized protein LOC141858284 isoform X2 n=1 Tax=Brevipalpus obovatus TaxID=246614 RepID=UPI003D9E2B5E
MLAESMMELSSICPPEEGIQSTAEPHKSSSLPSIEEEIPSAGCKSVPRGMTMKEMDAELTNLRRENFDLKLRLYEQENRRKSTKRAGDLPATENCGGERVSELMVECQEKDGLIKSLREQIEDVTGKFEFKINVLTKERDALVSDLESTGKVCKDLMEHLSQVREFWTKHANDNGSFAISEGSVLSSLGDLMDTTNDLLNSTQFKDSLEISMALSSRRSSRLSKELDESAAVPLVLVPSKSPSEAFKHFQRPHPALFHGASSLGLLEDMSMFNEDRASLVKVINECKSTQTDQAPAEEIISKDVGFQVTLRGPSTHDQECQPSISGPEAVDQSIQTILPTAASKEVQSTYESVDCEVQTDLKCIRKRGPSFQSPKTLEKPKKGIPRLILTPLRESNNSLTGLTIMDDLDYLNKENVPSKKTLSIDVESTPKPSLRPCKRSYTIMPSKDKADTPETPQLGVISTIPVPKSALKSATQRKNELNATVSKSVQFREGPKKMTSGLIPNIKDAIRVFLPQEQHQLLHNHLNRLAELVQELHGLNDKYLVLKDITEGEFSESVWPYLKDMRHIVNSSQVISDHFTIDESSILSEYQSIKAKKANIEKAVRRQVKQADKILRKAQLNLQS